MTSFSSLTGFKLQGSLTNADLVALESRRFYPIRNIGNLQPYAILLAVDPVSREILQVSANTAGSFGRSPAEMVGRSLDELFPEADRAAIAAALAQPEPHPPCTVTVQATGRSFRARLHPQDEILVLELEPEEPAVLAADAPDEAWQGAPPADAPSPEASGNRPALDLADFDRNPLAPEVLHRQLDKAIAAFGRAKTLQDFTDILAQQVRDLSGFDRVMVYRFQSDYSGVVVSEVKPDGRESYLGLHYPATDIPSEARLLFYENALRCIPAIDYPPVPFYPAKNPRTQAALELGPVWTRGVSPPHVQYLKTMDVAGAMTLSLFDDRHLWGLVACHHYRPKFVSAAERSAFQLLAKVATLELIRHQTRERDRYRSKTRTLLSRFRAAVDRPGAAILPALQEHAGLLMELFQASGVALAFAGQVARAGEAPTEAELQPAIDWLLQRDSEGTFATDRLLQDYPDSQHWAAPPAGLLAISVALQQPQPASYHILLFRPEQIQTVNWAGKLSDSIQVDATGELQLCPRNSFQLWKARVRDRAMPWSAQELEAAADLQNALMLAALRFSKDALEAALERS